jgi:hypothetical protein
MQTLIKPAEVVNTGIYRPAPVTARFDVNQISPHVKDSEERFLQPLLGVALYDDMIAQQNPLESNYNPAVGAIVNKFIAPAPAIYETLWTSFLLRYTAYAVYYEVLPYLTIQVSSKGIYQNDSEFAQNAGVQGVRFLQDNMMQRIDNLKPLIENFLCENKTDLPLFDAKNCPCEDDCGGCHTICNCGYWNMTGKHCHACETKKNTSTNIIFY